MSIFTVPPAASIGAPISDIDTPALLLDLDAFERNLDELQARADAAGMALRPHGKAHKCPAVARPDAALVCTGVSDEHCTVALAADTASTAGAFALPALPALGELVLLVPGHVDPTINLHDSLIGYRHGVVEAIWPVAARGLSR